jgi:archaellum component FlaC
MQATNQQAQLDEQDDDMENIRLRIDRKRQESEALSARDARKNDLCNKIQAMKNSFPGLRDRINALQDSDPDMATYIRKLEAISEDFHTPAQATTQVAVPDVLEKIAQRVLDAEDRANKLRQDLRAQDDLLRELRAEIKKIAVTHTQASGQSQVPPVPARTAPAVPAAPAHTMKWEGFDESSLAEPELPDYNAYIRDELVADMAAENLLG